jgi:hypothetical protein
MMTGKAIEMAIVSVATGEYDDSKEYTAWELAADWWWVELGYDAVIVGGNARYENATVTRNSSVKLSKLDADLISLCQINRYVNSDTKMRLVRID